jgi:hypothetical protein
MAMIETALTTVFSRRRRLVFETRRRPISIPRDPAKAVDSQWIEKAKALPDLRFEKVQALRTAIANGQYDLDARLTALLEDLPRDLVTLADAT